LSILSDELQDKLFSMSQLQYKTLLDTCDRELDTIDASFDTEKGTLRKTQNTELEGLFEDRRNKEVYALS
jgi:hypothetical protein